MTPLVAYSALYGAYDAIKVQPDMGVPLVLYTDDPHLVAPGWEVRHEPLANVGSPMMRAKLWKCRPDLAVPEASVSIWLDASLTVKRPELPRVMLQRLGSRDALFLRHPWRRCIYEEEVASRPAPKYRDQPMAAQVAHYRARGHPVDGGLYAATMVVRRATPAVERFGAAWFQECQRWSYQDQLSLPYVLRSVAPLSFGRLDDRWEHWWTIAPHAR